MENINKILNTERTLEKTVEDLEQYHHYPSNDYLMISELIDNSISSYLGSNENNNVKGLIIDITIDRSNKDNYKLTLIDNANGMDVNTLENAIYFGNPKQLQKNTSLNVYGVGLKQSAFYSGRRLDILTKTKDSIKSLETYIDLTELEKTPSRKIVFTIKESEKNIFIDGKKYDSGTKITISHLRKYRYSFDTKKDAFVQSLGWRYNRYIENGLTIILHYLTGDSKVSFSEKIRPTRPKADNYFEWKKANKNKIKSDEFNITEKIDQEIDDKSFQTLTEYDHFLSFFIRNNGNNDMLWDIEIEVVDNIKIKGKIGILAHTTTIKNTEFKKQHYTRYNGFTLFQKGRAIKCGPNDKKYQVNTFNVIADDISGGQNQKRRWFGEFDLDPLMDGDNRDNYIELDSNKRDIKWIHESAKINFEEEIRSYIRKYDKLLQAFNSIQNSMSSAKAHKDKSTQEVVAQTTKGSSKHITNSNLIIDENTNSVNKIVYDVQIPDIDKKIKTIVSIKDSTDNELKFIDYRRDKNDENGNYVIEIIVNSDHQIWKPLFGEENVGTNALISLHKLAITQGLTQWLLDYITENSNSKHINPDILARYKGKTYTEVCSLIATNIFRM